MAWHAQSTSQTPERLPVLRRTSWRQALRASPAAVRTSLLLWTDRVVSPVRVGIQLDRSCRRKRPVCRHTGESIMEKTFTTFQGEYHGPCEHWASARWWPSRVALYWGCIVVRLLSSQMLMVLCMASEML